MAADPLDRIIVVLGARAEEIRAGAVCEGAEPLVCDDWDEGMGASLRAGIAALPSARDVAITLGDQPRISSRGGCRVLGGPRGGLRCARPTAASRAIRCSSSGRLPRRASSAATAARACCSRGAAPGRWSAGRLGAPTMWTYPKRSRMWPRDEARALIRGPAPLDRVWETMIDVERVAPCLPGAAITGSRVGIYQAPSGEARPTTASTGQARHWPSTKPRTSDDEGERGRTSAGRAPPTRRS